MIKALIVEDRKKRGMILEINFNIYLEAQTTVVSSLSQLKKILSGDELPAWDLIVCRDVIEGSSVFDMLDEKIENLGIDKPVVVQVDRQKINKLESIEKIVYAEENGPLRHILSPVAKLFEITPTIMAKYQVPDPYPIDSTLLEYLISSPCDIYTDEEKEHCVLRSGELVEKDIIEGFVGGDVYLDAGQRIKFVNAFTDQFGQMADLLANPDVDLKEKMSALDKTLKFLSKEFQNGGMDEEVADLSHQCVISMVEISNQDDGLQGLQKLLMSEEYGERFLIAQLVIFYSLHMIKLLDWILEDPELNIPYAAFFHDLLLESDKWTTIRSNEALEKTKLDGGQKEKIERHGDLTASFFEPWESVPNEACRLIREHHGSTDGRGFLNNMDGISNMSKAFLVAEEWAMACLPFYQKQDVKKEPKRILNSMKLKFEGKGYSELIGALELLEVVDLEKIVEYWQSIDSPEAQEQSLEKKMKESGLFTDDQIGQWEVVSYIHQRLEVVKEQGLHLFEQDEVSLITESLDKSGYIIRVLTGAFSDGTPESIEPEVLLQLKDSNFEYIQKAEKFYDILLSFRVSRDIKVTDLMLASGQGKLGMVKFVLEKKLEDVNLIDLEGKTALLYSVINGHTEVMEYLLAQGAKLDHVDRMRRGPLYHSLIQSNEELFFRLIELGARPSQQAVGGVSLLMVCALKGLLKSMKHLIENTGADINGQDANKKTVQDYAQRGGHKEIMEYVSQFF